MFSAQIFVHQNFLYAKTNDDVLKWINYIVSKSLNRIQIDGNVYPEISLPNFMSNHFYWLTHVSSDFCLTASAQDQHGKLMNVQNPVRMPVFLDKSPQDLHLSLDSIDYADRILPPDSASKSYSNFPTHLVEESYSSPDSQPSVSSDMSLEDFDRSYRELQLDDIDMLSNIEVDNNFENACHSESAAVDFPRQFKPYSEDNLKLNIETMDDSDSTIHSDCYLSSPMETNPSILNELPTCPSSSRYSEDFDIKYPPMPKLSPEPIINVPRNVTCKPKVSFLCEDECVKSPRMAAKDFSRFMYKNKKKSPIHSSKPAKSVKLLAQRSSILSRSFRVQKGLCSKTVCKDNLFKKPHQYLNDYSNSSFSALSENSGPQFELASFQAVENADKPSSEPSQCLNSSWLSQRSVLLTPNQSHRLSYEKVPGGKGQTRLVFH